MNMMRKNNNRNNNMKHRSGGGGNGGGPRRYGNNGGGGNGAGNRGANDSQNIQRQKHHATQQLGKYSDMARNAQINGDRVDVEYYLQHVDHYTRVLTDIAAIEAERYAHQREAQIIPGGPNDPNATQHNDQANGEQHPPHQQAANDTPQDTSAPSQDVQADTNEAQSVQQPQQPQQPRPPRQRQPRPQQSDNGAKEANSNTTEIPLPGSILPPI